MERVRIRSMLNNIKAYHPSLSARKVYEPSQTKIQVQSDKNYDEQKYTVHHSCFLLQPLQDDPRQKLNSTIFNEQKRKNGSTATKQGSKRRTKIANKSYMFGPIKNKDAQQNLKQLGIKTKIIANRREKGFRSTQKHLKFEMEFQQYLNETQTNIKNIKKTMETIQNRSSAVPVQRKKSVPDTWRHNFEDKVKKQNVRDLGIIKGTKNSGYNIHYIERRQKILSGSGSGRKNSDITPWEYQSANLLVL